MLMLLHGECELSIIKIAGQLLLEEFRFEKLRLYVARFDV